MKYPNYRVSVEALIIKDNKIFITKRADGCKVAPGIWNVPAGKVKYEEIPTDAVIREVLEETQLEVKIVSEVGARAFKFEMDSEDAFRLVYTYLVAIVGENKEPIIDEEHSIGIFVSREELDNVEYDSMKCELKDFIKKVL